MKKKGDIRPKQILDNLNRIEPDHIKFTIEEEEDNRLPVLDLALMVNRKTKKIEFTVHYKMTHKYHNQEIFQSQRQHKEWSYQRVCVES